VNLVEIRNFAATANETVVQKALLHGGFCLRGQRRSAHRASLYFYNATKTQYRDLALPHDWLESWIPGP